MMRVCKTNELAVTTRRKALLIEPRPKPTSQQADKPNP